MSESVYVISSDDVRAAAAALPEVTGLETIGEPVEDDDLDETADTEGRMSIHHFTLTVSGLTYDQTDRLYEAGCDDALLSECNGVVTLDFAREAPDMLTAIASAIDDIVRSGALVRHLEPIRESEPA
jgi:hypothetical protein